MLTDILYISVAVSPVIVLFLLLSKPLQKRFQPRLKYWLWLILALRLLIPFSVTLPQTAMDHLPAAGTLASITEKTAVSPRKPVDEGTAPALQTVTGTGSAPADSVHASTGQAEVHSTGAGAAAVSSGETIPPTAEPEASPAAVPEERASISWQFVLTVVYCAGAVLFILYYFTAYLHLRRKLRRWGRAPGELALDRQLQSMARKAGLKKPVRLMIVETVHTPMVVGFFRPALILPWEEWEPATLQHVLAHEVIHIRRRDLLYKLVLLGANALHWFNPLVWLMRSRADQDLEICCDAEALHNASAKARRQYSETILAVAGQTLRRETSVTTAFGSTKKSIMERFTEIYRKGKRHQGLLLLLAVVLAAALAGCRTSLAEETGASAVSALSGSEKADAAAADHMYAYTLEGKVENDGCYGNLIYVDGSYYTMTENGPENVEVHSLDTTVAIHGTWDVNLDYAVIDGELAFRDRNVPVGPYAVLDGEKVFWSDYMENTPDEEQDSSIAWCMPQVATVSPAEGRTDTVLLTIRISEKSQVETCHYSFYYNLTTGEIMDPLGQIPYLFDQGNLSSVQFNAAGDKALALFFGVNTAEDGSVYTGESCTYLLDFNAGTMTPVFDLLSPYFPEPKTDGTVFTDNGSCCWAGGDAILYTATEAIPKENTEDDMDPWERCVWLFSYDTSDGTLNYKLRDVENYTFSTETSLPYLRATGADGTFKLINTENGTVWVPAEDGFEQIDYELWDDAHSHAVLVDLSESRFYVDCEKQQWSLLDGIDVSREELYRTRLISGKYLCFSNDEKLVCYVIPENLPSTPLTFNASSDAPAETVESAESAQESEYALLTSGETGMTLQVLAGYENEISIDQPYTGTLRVSADTAQEINYTSVPFAFYDAQCQTGETDGLVWGISVWPRAETEQSIENSLLLVAGNPSCIFNQIPLGSSGGQLYMLFFWAPDKASAENPAHYDQTDSACIQSYARHAADGLEIVEDFVTRNHLEENADWVDWRQRYTQWLLDPAEKAASENSDKTTAAQTAASGEFADTLSTYSTQYTSDAARNNNIALACQAIDGTVLQPGETFSFNDVVGERTAEKGYQEAAAYSGDSTRAIGGGISQVTSTLYACALYADLEIVQRESNTFFVTFVPGGLDAAVYWGSVDFQFKNSTGHPLRIDAGASASQCNIALVGTDENHYTVEIESRLTASTPYDTVISDDVEPQNGCRGYVFEITRYVYDDGGKLVRTDTTADLDAMGGLGTSGYSKRDQIVPSGAAG